MSNNDVVPSVLIVMNISSWYIPNYLVLSERSLDTVIPNDLIGFVLMGEWSINFPKNRASFSIGMYTVLSSCTTVVAALPTGTLVIDSY